MEEIDSNKKLKKYFNENFISLRKSLKKFESTSKYFGEIGSTDIEDIPYTIQLQIKNNAVKKIFSNCNLKEDKFEKIEGSPKLSEYRFRMDYVASFDPFHEPNSRFGQRKKKNFKWVVDMDEEFLINHSWFGKARQVYLELQNLGIRNYDLVKKDGILRYIILRVHKNTSMLSIITSGDSSNTHLSEKIEEVAKYAQELGFSSIYWIINNTQRDESDGEIIKFWGEELLEIEFSSGIKLKTGPQNFFQNNIEGFEKIINYVESYLSQINEKKNVLIDLYSGVGTIGISLAKHFKNVIGFEINAKSVELSKHNAEFNKFDNIEYSSADLNSSEFQVDDNLKNAILVVDPPRPGLEKNGVKHVLKFDPKIIIYISCNPITQAQDIKNINENETKYNIVSVKPFDLFPHTYHLENVVILERV